MVTKEVPSNPIRLLLGGSFRTGKYVEKNESLFRLVTNLVSLGDNYLCNDVQFRLIKQIGKKNG
jgi:hypothetical protein